MFERGWALCGLVLLAVGCQTGAGAQGSGPEVMLKDTEVVRVGNLEKALNKPDAKRGLVVEEGGEPWLAFKASVSDEAILWLPAALPEGLECAQPPAADGVPATWWWFETPEPMAARFAHRSVTIWAVDKARQCLVSWPVVSEQTLDPKAMTASFKQKASLSIADKDVTQNLDEDEDPEAVASEASFEAVLPIGEGQVASFDVRLGYSMLGVAFFPDDVVEKDEEILQWDVEIPEIELDKGLSCDFDIHADIFESSGAVLWALVNGKSSHAYGMGGDESTWSTIDTSLADFRQEDDDPGRRVYNSSTTTQWEEGGDDTSERNTTVEQYIIQDQPRAELIWNFVLMSSETVLVLEGDNVLCYETLTSEEAEREWFIENDDGLNAVLHTHSFSETDALYDPPGCDAGVE